MKKLTVLLGLIALFATELVFANAIATSVSGSAQVASGTAPPRPLRTGDTVRQGDTVSTGPGSSIVLKFDDGQVAAITSNSRMTVSTYDYNPQAQSGNVVLSLVSGGMRAITGLIGRLSPQKVSYRAASATIGIRGTDVTIVTLLGNVVVTVEEGFISFTFAGQTITVTAGQGVNAKTDGTFQAAAAAQIINQAPADVQNAINGLQGLSAAITQAASGQGGQLGTSTTSTPGTSGPTSSGGGGTASTR